MEILRPNIHIEGTVKPCLTLRQISCCLLNFLSAAIFKVLQCRSKLVKMLSVKQLGSGWDTELLGISSISKLFAYGTIVMLSGLTLSVWEPHLCLCKQVGSRPAAGWLRSNLFATQSIISHKKQTEFKGFIKQTTI